MGNPPKEYPIRVGSMLFVLTDPGVGHEVEYNRWYERDHIYAGCMIGPWFFSGGRWVATRALKDLRLGEGLNNFPIDAGSYMVLVWVLDGHHDELLDWATDQVNWLYANDRGFEHRTHIGTSMYMDGWRRYRDDDPIPLELALDHRYAGAVAMVIEREEDVTQEELDDWMQSYVEKWMAGSPVATVASWLPSPLKDDAPTFVPRDPMLAFRSMQTHFLEVDPSTVWDRYEQLATDLLASDLGRVAWAAPFIPTIVGTDTYTDQLW